MEEIREDELVTISGKNGLAAAFSTERFLEGRPPRLGEKGQLPRAAEDASNELEPEFGKGRLLAKPREEGQLPRAAAGPA